MSMPTDKPALVLDWGIGGLSVYREIKRMLPSQQIIYVSDSGHVPYGKVPERELGERVGRVISWARENHHVGSATIACNAASTALELVRAICADIPVLGVIAAGIELVQESGCRKIGVIGGMRTIESRIFSSALPGFEVRERVAQPLSALIEAGKLGGPELDRELAQILAPIEGVEALLLACTHYPAIAAPIQKHLPGVRLLDPARRTAEQLRALLPVPVGLGEDLFFTSGSREGSKAAAAAAFGVSADFQPWDPT